ncbi:MAG: hypothetical protein ACKOXF_00445 [Chitinophagaceae bacterium]
MKSQFLTYVIILFIIVSCQSKNLYKKDKDLSIIFGSGGGFTGATEQYELSGRGSLIKVGIPGDTTKLPSMSKSQKRYLRQLVNSDSLSRISYDTYANMTSFMYVKVKGQQVYSFHWNGDSKVLPAPLFSLDSFLNTLVKKS